MASIEKLGNGAKSMFVPLDVANEESWIAAMDAVEKELGPISVLVRCEQKMDIRSTPYDHFVTSG